MENIIFKIIKGNNNEDLLVYVSSTLKKFWQIIDPLNKQKLRENYFYGLIIESQKRR